MKYLVTVIEQSRITEMIEADSENDAVTKLNDYDFSSFASTTQKTKHIEVRPAEPPLMTVVEDNDTTEIVTIH